MAKASASIPLLCCKKLLPLVAARRRARTLAADKNYVLVRKVLRGF